MSTENIEAPGQGKAGGLSSAALARRRILLKGVGKGAAVLAATVPLQTLAGQRLITFDGQHQCSISGMHSGVHSATTTAAVCGGYGPDWWGQSETINGKLVPSHAWPVPFKTQCKQVFKASGYLRNTDGGFPTLFEVLSPADNSRNFADTDEFHWICAWLNALSFSFNFPYSGDEVLAFYNQGSASPAYRDALEFFKTYMETHTS